MQHCSVPRLAEGAETSRSQGGGESAQWYRQDQSSLGGGHFSLAWSPKDRPRPRCHKDLGSGSRAYLEVIQTFQLFVDDTH